MGCCVSRKQAVAASSLPRAVSPTPATSSSVISSKIAAEKRTIKPQIENKPAAAALEEEEQPRKGREEEGSVKKEIFIIKHRKSHDRERSSPAQQTNSNNAASVSSSGEETAKSADANHHPLVRTSSCTKEEVDAILIQCGRLSRSNSSGKTASSARKYSGSKRSYDFDNDNDAVGTPDLRSKREGIACDDDENAAAERRRHRHRQRPSSRSSSQGRRRTPSRERDQQQRSGSRERSSSSSNGRRVSRSPGRRSDNAQQQATPNPGTRPGKMVSVPATVSSLAMDKSNNCGEANTVKRISVKRNVGAASPRSQSPARVQPNAAGKGGHEAQQPSLSRSSSRKAEHSPYRRNPLSEIDPNTLAYPHSAANKGLKDPTSVINQAATQKQNFESGNMKAGNFSAIDNNCTSKEELVMEEPKAQQPMAANVTLTRVAESLRPHTVTRSRSSRLSRDLDINPETLTNPNPSYTALLLEDIQNFHQKNNTAGPTQPSFSLPACVSKACSILEAVADLNSTTSSTAFSEKGHHQAHQSNNYKDPFVESEVAAHDLMEPSLHKYVTVTRGGGGDMEEEEEEESSGSNSFAGGSVGHHWGLPSSSSWEPNSADSTDRWTSSRSNTRESSSQFGRKTVSETRRVGGSKALLHTTPLAVGAAASM